MSRDGKRDALGTIRRARWPLALGLSLLLLIGVIFWLVQGGSGGFGVPQGATLGSRLVGAHAGLCEADAAARRGDPQTAARIFLDQAHVPLHELAAAVQVKNIEAASRLLEAKYRVETTLFGRQVAPSEGATIGSATPSSGANASDALSELSRATDLAAADVGVTLGAC